MKSSRPLLSSIGFDVVATVAGGALVGYWIDRHYKSAPWGLLIGSVLGLLAGLYTLVREALRINRGPEAGPAEGQDRAGSTGSQDRAGSPGSQDRAGSPGSQDRAGSPGSQDRAGSPGRQDRAGSAGLARETSRSGAEDGPPSAEPGGRERPER
jgi:hypothetical protein